VNGNKYQSEDILEIVKYSPASVYFRAHLEFFNGHMCGIYGIADIEGNDIIYHGLNNSEGEPCTLRIRVSDKEISLSDPGGNCRTDTCGSRGGYESIAFPRSSRRRITYLDDIRNSDAYWGAAEEHDAGSGHASIEDAHEAGAFRHLMQRARQGDTGVSNRIAMAYDLGRGVEKNGAEAFKWYLTGAEKGNAASQYAVAHFYERDSDYANALPWYRKAAEQGHENALYRLGLFYANGWGVERDDKEAYFWLKTALLADCMQHSILKSAAETGARLNDADRARIDRRAAEWKPHPGAESEKEKIFVSRRKKPAAQECADYKKRQEDYDRKRAQQEKEPARYTGPAVKLPDDSPYPGLIIDNSER
jgi:hypothetical protein